MDKFDSIVACGVTEEFEKKTENEKERYIFQCKDAVNEAEIEAIANEIRSDYTSEIVAAVANTDQGNLIENSGVR